MGIKERVKDLESKIGKLPQAEMERVMNILGRAMVDIGGACRTPSNDGEPVTQEEFDWLLSRLKRLREGI